MTGRRVQHLVVRGKSFQVRLYVPVDLQSVLDRRELRWSVRTREPSVAKSRALNATLALQRLCDKLRLMKKLSVDDAREIAQAFYQKLADSYRSPPPEPDDAPPYLYEQQEEMVEEEIERLQAQIEMRDFGPGVTQIAHIQAHRGGYQMPEPGTEAFRALCEGVARAQIEHSRFSLFRLRDLLSPYQAKDELFRELRGSLAPSTMQVIAAPSGAMSLREALDKYVAVHTSGPNAWKPKTGEEKERTFKMVLAFLGPDRSIADVGTDEVRSVRNFIQALKAELLPVLRTPS